MDQPLRGLRVLDLSRLLPGPFCTLILSDLGAAVDKLEDPHVGDYLRVMPPLKNGLSGRFNALNRDKRSVCLDLKAPAGREALLRLAARYDVLVESFRPGVLDRLGLGYATLAERNPRLVLCSISGYGQTGPYRDRAGHDLNYTSIAGVVGQNGEAGGPPIVPGVQIADIAGGALWGAVGILAALHGVTATGRGRQIDVSMCEGSLAFLLPELGNLDAGAGGAGRGAGTLDGGLACYRVYRTRDGKHLSVAALEPKFWMALNAKLGRAADPSELIAPPAEQERVRAELQAILETRTRDEWEAHFAGADVCVEPVLAVDELANHPQHRARGVFYKIGEVGQVRTPFGTSEGHRLPPAMGADGAAILGEAGFSPDEIATLRQAGVTR